MSANQMEQLAAEIKRLSDIDAIKQLKAKYVRLADAKDWDAWGQLFVEDSHLHTDGGPVEGRANIVATISRSLATAKTAHRLAMPEIEITGPDTASAKWPVSDFVKGTFGEKAMTIRGFGYYYEDYVRTAEGWRLKRGQLIRQHVEMTSDPAQQ